MPRRKPRPRSSDCWTLFWKLCPCQGSNTHSSPWGSSHTGAVSSLLWALRMQQGHVSGSAPRVPLSRADP